MFYALLGRSRIWCSIRTCCFPSVGCRKGGICRFSAAIFPVRRCTSRIDLGGKVSMSAAMFRVGLDSPFGYKVSEKLSGGHSKSAFYRIQFHPELIKNVETLLEL